MNMEGWKENERLLSELHKGSVVKEVRPLQRSQYNSHNTNISTTASDRPLSLHTEKAVKVEHYSHLKRNAKDFAGGLVGGILGICLSHPFDTLRVRLQAATTSTTPSISLSTFKFNQTVQLLSSLYKGFIPPLIGVGAEKFIAFGTFNWTRRTFFGEKDTLLSTFISGSVAGAACTLIVTPVEQLKIRLQNGGKLSVVSLVDLYKGWSATLWREIPGFGLYFSWYYCLKKLHPIDRSSKVGHFLPFLYGGISGALTWTVVYPADLIKTRIQSDHLKYDSWTSAVQGLFKKEGIRGFYRGFSFALMRAVPLHAGVFFGYEWFQRIAHNL